MHQLFNGERIKDLLKKGYFSYTVILFSLIILPIHVKYLPPFMILMVIFRILEGNFRTDQLMKLETPLKLLFGLFILYYLWQVAGLIYTSDIKMGLSNLFGRLSLIIFPVVLILPGEMIKSKIKTLIRVFAISTFVFILFCFLYAFYKSVHLQNGIWSFNPHPDQYDWLNYFYSTDLTFSQHPTYISMYVLISSFICFESYFDLSVRFLRRIFWLILGILLSISQYFLSSRAGILTCLILIPLYLIVKFKQYGKRKYAWIWIVLVFISILPFIVKNQRVDYFLGRFSQNQTDYVRKEDPRIKIWKSSFEVARKHMFLGVGIGDVRTQLSLEYTRIGEDQMARIKYNAHNQFLEVLVENGIIGLLIFVSIFLCMICLAWKDSNLLYFMFILISFMFFLFETVLYRLAGVSFFAFFSFLLIYSNQRKHSWYKHENEILRDHAT
jgi:O-antigen ligase